MEVFYIPLANVLLFAAYTGLAMLVTWSSMVSGQQPGPIVVIFFAAFQLSAVPVACVVNWWLLRIRNPIERVVAGIGLGLIACAIFVVPYCVCLLKFYLAMGGTL